LGLRQNCDAIGAIRGDAGAKGLRQKPHGARGAIVAPVGQPAHFEVAGAPRVIWVESWACAGKIDEQVASAKRADVGALAQRKACGGNSVGNCVIQNVLAL
jgi:hypothetical protein